MAKVKGPLFSMEASGAYGGALVFGQRKGSAVVRKLVTPSNPQTQDQEDARNAVRIGGVLQTWVNNTALKQSGETKTDKELLTAAAPSHSTWNAHLVKAITGKGALTLGAAKTAYAALTAPQKSAWVSAAAALTPAISAASQTEEGGVQITPMTAGEVFFVYQYGLASIGLAPTPTGTPPAYA